MKVKVRRSIADALRLIANRVDPSTGERIRYESPDYLKRRVSLLAVAIDGLEQTPEDIGSELRFLCPWHNDTNPSLWLHENYNDTGVGRWGCNVCGISGDVLDFVQKLHGLTFKEAVDWVKKWDYSHNRAHTAGRIVVHLPSRRKRA